MRWFTSEIKTIAKYDEVTELFPDFGDSIVHFKMKMTDISELLLNLKFARLEVNGIIVVQTHLFLEFTSLAFFFLQKLLIVIFFLERKFFCRSARISLGKRFFAL